MALGHGRLDEVAAGAVDASCDCYQLLRGVQKLLACVLADCRQRPLVVRRDAVSARELLVDRLRGPREFDDPRVVAVERVDGWGGRRRVDRDVRDAVFEREAVAEAVEAYKFDGTGADGPRSEGGRRILLDNSRVYVRFLPFVSGRVHLTRISAH